MTALLALAAALAGFLAGYLAKGGRTTPVPQGSTASTAPVPALAPLASPVPEPSAPSVDPAPLNSTALNSTAVPDDPPTSTLRAAREVLEVVDHLTNAELARRLVEAVVLLPDIAALRPRPGDPYESLVHEWAGHRITDEESRWNTIAATLAPGAIADEQLLRPAHVIVFEPPEQS
jgi:hypothetical protein